ncbi:MAG: beta-ketoacyl-[acyl-carrier-protein] synthase family protein [Verrucomicrobia bacterium]|nr:beta-ketoacyl-[acyl-carrier-protein] synthase family protein [Verrucomicrobiota bacterium]
MDSTRIVITGVGLTSPLGNSLADLRSSLLQGRGNVTNIETRYMGTVHAGVCEYDARKYQSRRELRNSTRAGSISIYCAHEAINDSGINWATVDTDRVGVYIGITEHGNVETENEIYNISQFNYDVRYWSHHHNPRTVANNPAGEITLNMGIHGPHYTIGAACAAGNAGLIQGYLMLKFGEVDLAIAGGVSESIHTFGIFAAFKSQGALGYNADPNRASRPFDVGRNGIVVSEGGALYTLERLSDAKARGAKIYGEIVGYHINSDAVDAVLPDSQRQVECMQAAMKKAALQPRDIHIVNTHATSTPQGDIQECNAIKTLFPTDSCPDTRVNNTKSFLGHAMGAAGAIELAGNLPSFQDNFVHPTINVDELDPNCDTGNLVIAKPEARPRIDTILNNSFGMLGINSCLIVKRFKN